MRRTNATLGQVLFGLPTASSQGSCGARALLPSLDGSSVEGAINEDVRLALDALNEPSKVVGDELGGSGEPQAGYDLWVPNEPASTTSLQHVWREQAPQGYTAPTAQKKPNEVCMVADHAASFKIEFCPINNNTNAVALSPQPHLPDLAGEMMAEGMSYYLPRPVLLPRQPLPVPQQAGFLLMPQAPPVSAPAASAGTEMGGGSGGGESLAVGVLSVAVAGLLLPLLVFLFARLLGRKCTEKDQTNDDAETYREVLTFSPGADLPSGSDDDSTWSQGRVGEVWAMYASMQPVDPLDNEEEEEQEHEVEQGLEEQHQQQDGVEEEERPGSYSHLLGDYPAAPHPRLGFNLRMPIPLPRLRLRRPTLPAMTLPPMRFPRPWAKVPAAPVARRSSLAEGPVVEMATIAPPSTRSTSDATHERSESTAPHAVSAAGELAVTPRKRSFGDKVKGGFARRRSSSAGRSRWGHGLPDEAMHGLMVVEGGNKGTGLLRRKPSAANVWTKAL